MRRQIRQHRVVKDRLYLQCDPPLLRQAGLTDRQVWFAPDQDYGPRGSVFAPLFAVDQAATTSGTFMLARMANPALVPVVLIRREGGRGYDLLIQPALEDYPLSDEQAAAAYMNKVIEKEIMRAPEQYMWLHRRFKTRPAGAPSLY